MTDKERLDALEAMLLHGAEVSAYINFIRLEFRGELYKQVTLREAIDEAIRARKG